MRMCKKGKTRHFQFPIILFGSEMRNEKANPRKREKSLVGAFLLSLDYMMLSK